MKKLFFDFETLWGDDYSLRKMTPIEYILDPRFEVLVCGFAWEDDDRVEPFCVDGPDLAGFIAGIDWSDTEAISHNAQFDALILAFRYGVYPKRYGCSLSMAQNWIAHQVKTVSLENCAKRFGLPEKMLTVQKTKNVNWHQLSQDPTLLAEVRSYAIDDAVKCRAIYEAILADGFPKGELDTVDWTIRMAARPQLEIDALVVAEHLGEVIARKDELLRKAGLETRDNLMRDDVLAASLTFLGVDSVPRKISKKTQKEQWAFAKTDKEFTDLLDHENPDVQALVAARLGHKSTGEQTRAERFLAVSRLTSGVPIPLRYSGAHTHRFSGGWKLNMQNLANGSKLRNALRAPKGSVVVSVDASQIEARINATLSGETWLIESFREGRDVYADFAGVIYNRPILKQLDPVERFVGKVAILSLGYGSSWPVFQGMCRNQGDVTLTDTMAMQAVAIYRAKCSRIVENWKAADKSIIPMLTGTVSYRTWGPLVVDYQKLILPNGNALKYHQLAYEHDEEYGRMQWTYMRGEKKQKLYGAKLVENVCQALAFVHIADVALRVAKMTEGELWPAHQVHDELIYVVPEHLAGQVGDLVKKEMSQPPKWLPTVPLAAEVKMGPSYGEVE